jgi:predicted DNA-binding transcriptional regulator AlpA
MNPRENDHEVLTLREASELLRISPSMVYRLTKEAGFLRSKSARTGDFKRRG